ncbi:site-2 protease family protein [Paenibacillus sp. NFR01]|uniref:site-2 protease family protein n=1 Tax=Paenibacillus sp. NFR01 TaxID=1566279 RepID=UPI0020C88890|nr:site-2 protease family protein [Paenibacillus sp. NFR01]
MAGKEQSDSKNIKKGTWTWLGGVAAMLLVKGKAILALLKLSKIASPFISMLISIWAYTLIYPWQFAIGFVLLLLIHETGHVIAAKRIGLPVSAPLFVPFMGALITMKKQPLDAKQEAYLAFGGPLLGSLGAAACFALGYVLDSPLLYSLAYIGFLLNLINLLPIHPLDGGRIVTAVSRWLWLVGLIGGLAVIIYMQSVLFFIIWVLFAYDLYGKYVKRRKNSKLNSVTFNFTIPADSLREQGYFIPGPDHRRELPFTTYSNLERQQILEIHWDSLNYSGTAALPVQCLVEKVEVKGVDQLETYNGFQLKARCEVHFKLYENDKYYDVPAGTRWRYGVAYFALASILGGMIYLVHVVGNINV